MGQDGTIPTIDCQGPTDDRQISLSVYTLNEKAIVRYGNDSKAGGVTVLCGGPTNVYVEPEMAHLFLNTVKIYDGHRAHFPFPTIPRIEAGLYDDGNTYYHHNSTNGELHMAKLPNMIYGEDGVMFVTHEYGHHYQDRYLFTSPDEDGLMRFTRGCATQHPPESLSSFGCALGEGFADWYALVVRGADLPDWLRRTEGNWFYINCRDGYTSTRGRVTCTTDGSIVQGAVTAMLWDMIDQSTEDHDRIRRWPEDIARGMKQCRVRVGSNWIGYNGIDHFIYCMENRLPYNVSVRSAATGRDTVIVLFNTRPANQYPNANSGTWLLDGANATEFRRLWLVNLYSKHAHISASPVLRNVEPEPTPLPPADDGGGGGGCGLPECPIIY